MRYYEKERDCIDRFREEYEFLSNFYPAKVKYDGILYDNSEGAYQAQKCKNYEDRKIFSEMYSDEAKRFGRQVEIREDWDEIKVQVMEEVVAAKFEQNPLLAKRLLETGEKYLAEGNYWHDVFWGVDQNTGEGKNHLGIILMELREKYKKEGLPEEKENHLYKTYGPIGGIIITDRDIIQLDVECVVNAANKTLLGGTGVDGVIHREAGPELLEECRSLNGCEVGQAKITKGYKLKADYVIHAVGPIYGKDEETLLELCYKNTLDLAMKHGIHTIAFPALSTGKFCFPKQKAMEIAVKTVRDWLENHNDYELQIIFSCLDKRIYEYACAYLECEK